MILLKVVIFEIFTAVTMKNSVFWDVALCRSCVDRRFGGTYRLYLQGRKIRERGTSVSRSREILDLLTQLKTSSNYGSIADLHALQTINTRYVLSVFTSRILATDVNSGDSSIPFSQVLPVRRISRK
jgi:hypothetical protein